MRCRSSEESESAPSSARCLTSGTAPAVEALVVLDMALAAKLTNRTAMSGYAGRPGAARLRALAQLAAPAESPMETRLRWLLVKSRLPTPDVQADLHDEAGRFVGRADIYYPSARLVIEFDGGNHRERPVGDNRRQNALIAAGYRVLRFTGADLRDRPDGVVAQSGPRSSPWRFLAPLVHEPRQLLGFHRTCVRQDSLKPHPAGGQSRARPRADESLRRTCSRSSP